MEKSLSLSIYIARVYTYVTKCPYRTLTPFWFLECPFEEDISMDIKTVMSLSKLTNVTAGTIFAQDRSKQSSFTTHYIINI